MGGSDWRAKEDAVWFNGFLTLKYCKNAALSLQTCNAVSSTLRSVVLGQLDHSFIHSCATLPLVHRKESHRTSPVLISQASQS